MKGLDEIFSTVGYFVVGPAIIGAASYFVVKFSEYLKQRKTSWSINVSAEKNEKIQERLTEVRVALDADRVYVSMFHNGFKYVDGSEVLKKSRTHESVAEGVTYEAEKYRNLMISHMTEEMKLVETEGPSFTLVADLPDC